MSFSSSPFNPDDILSKIIPNLWPFLTQLIAFIVLFLAVFFLAYKPVKKILKKRNEYIEDNIMKSKENELKSIERLNEAEAKLNLSYKEAKVIIDQAKADAETERVNIINVAKDEAMLTKTRAQEEIALEIKRSQEEIKQEMVEIALNASEKILEREIKDQDNEKLLNDFINDMKKGRQ